jgi:hypothetical protein
MRIPVHYADDVASEKAKRARVLRKAEDLRACPFCRELFVHDEGDVCPECGIPVRDIADLPPSPDAERLIHEEVGARPQGHTVPQAEPLKWSDLSRGRGPLLVLALLGLAAFYLPWAEFTAPENVTYTAAELARKEKFFWSAFTAWMVLFPAVASRRTILKMIGGRPAIVMLSAMPAVWCAFLMSRPAHKVIKGITIEYHWGPGFWATVALSLTATLIALRFGGRLDEPRAAARHGSSAGETVH